MNWDIDAALAVKIGFATHQNAVPVIRDLSVSAGVAGEGLSLSLSASPPFLRPRAWRIDAMAPGDTLHIADRDVSLDAGVLRGLTESLAGTLTLTLSDAAGATLAELVRPVELLARGQWGGIDAMAELLPAFVMPNDPAVDRVLKGASEVLRAAGRPDALDGYRSGSRERAWELASAIWSAVAGLRLSYALPPASFERAGQKVRAPSQILDGRVATCLDTSLLFAAALEQAGLNPLIVLSEGHALAGLWLQPVELATLMTDEAAALRRRLDLDDLILFETTLVTASPPASFGEAVAHARREIAEGAGRSFEMAIDVRRARMQRIRPLALVDASPAPSGNAEAPAAERLELPPPLPDCEVAATPAKATTPAGRILQWQRRLLNLTTSNNLLHVRDGKGVVKLLCPDPGALEDMLSGGRKVRIVPLPDLTLGGRDAALYGQQARSSLPIEIAQEAMARGEAMSLLAKDKLDAAMVELYRRARTDIEEGGANTLYLALGFLKWRKSPRDEKAYSAPLILLPVRLERKSALSGVTMIAHEDEPRFNLTLLELLRQDFELSIPGLDGDLPKDRSGVDVAGIWRTVRTAVRDIAGFEVVPDVALGTFSFAKYLMWKDLVDRADRLKESPLVRHLIDRAGPLSAGRPGGAGAFPRADELDAKVDPAELFTPLPADSSQLVAVVASAEGRDFVLDGPPGTGKSQTIANIIAHNMALGRRVLFVAEKRAALDVVQRRLADKGLAPFCLELHSAKATKSAVLRQLDSAWTARDALTAEEWAGEAADARRLRAELNAVVALLHRPEPSGWTLHRAIGRVVRDATDATPRLAFPASARHDAAEIAHLRDVSRRLGIARAAVAGLPAALEGVARNEWSSTWQEAVTAVATLVPAKLDAVEAAHAELAAATGLPLGGGDKARSERLLALAELCLTMHGHDMAFAFAPDMAERVAAAREGLALIARYSDERAQLSARYARGAARRIDVFRMQAAWMAAEAQVWPLGTLARRKVARALAEAGGVDGVVDPAVDLPRLAAMRDLRARVEGLSIAASGVPGWAGFRTDGKRVQQAMDRADRLRAAMAAEASEPGVRDAVPALVVEGNAALSPDGDVVAAAARLRRALGQLGEVIGYFEALTGAPVDESDGPLRARAGMIVAHASGLREWAIWRRAREDAEQAGLGPLAVALERGAFPPGAAVATFDTAYARWLAAVRMDEEPLLKTFLAGEQEDRIARFRAIDDRLAALSSRYIRAKLCGLIPDKCDVGRRDGYGTLRHQLQLQRPSLPVRRLVAEMGEAFTRLAPCMLMSPLSIAQYLPADQALFDLVIFDEASQITPWDAIGAMARGRQVIIAGDPRQMPPSNDFARSAVATDDETAPDMESILDECLAAGVPQHSLDWHYRSRHESLIAFSNTRYYGSKLVTFPAPETRQSAVGWRRVPGVYAPGARTNPIEAQAIVDEAVRRLCDPAFVDEAGAALTLGIITMNAEQMRLVEDLLDKARRARPEIEPHFDPDRLEPVCVRNLETAQGDERDVILLGVNFGPTEPGGTAMSMHFGKLNGSGGPRRLNVAVTRARREMLVFTSFDPGMIDLTRTASDGVRDLKAFIELADRGPRALAVASRGSLGGAESLFEEAVAIALQRRGWSVVPQVGVSRFRIDLGIVHPDRPGDYLVGVECDGASYHSAATARDRDKVRAAILEGLGWSLLRVWSTDWWADRERAADRLHAQIEALLAADREGAGVRFPDAPSIPLQPQAAPPARPGVAPRPTAVRPAPQPRRPAQAYARLAEPAVTKGDGLYRPTDFGSLAVSIDPERFYAPRYDTILIALIGHVLAAEAPIAEMMLVQRVARAHGFLRAGRIIRDRVMALAERLHEVEDEPDGGRFVWPDAEVRSAWDCARWPATDADIRQIEHIALAELRAARRGHDPLEVARRFGVRRLSAAARARIEMA